MTLSNESDCKKLQKSTLMPEQYKSATKKVGQLLHIQILKSFTHHKLLRGFEKEKKQLRCANEHSIARNNLLFVTLRQARATVFPFPTGVHERLAPKGEVSQETCSFSGWPKIPRKFSALSADAFGQLLPLETPNGYILFLPLSPQQQILDTQSLQVWRREFSCCYRRTF